MYTYLCYTHAVTMSFHPCKLDEATVHLVVVVVGIQHTQIFFVIPPVVRHDFRRTAVNSQFVVKLYHNVDNVVVGLWHVSISRKVKNFNIPTDK